MPVKRKTTQLKEMAWPKLPHYTHKQASAMEQYLLDRFDTRKPPTVAAKVLVLIVELYKRKQPFPLREHAAAYLHCSKYSIDGAITLAMARGLLTTAVDGDISHRQRGMGFIRQRFYIPHDDLLVVAGYAPQVKRAA